MLLAASGGLIAEPDFTKIRQADLFDDLSALQAQHRRSREVHLATRRRRQPANQEVVEPGAGVRAAALPTSDHVVTLLSLSISSETTPAMR